MKACETASVRGHIAKPARNDLPQPPKAARSEMHPKHAEVADVSGVRAIAYPQDSPTTHNRRAAVRLVATYLPELIPLSLVKRLIDIHAADGPQCVKRSISPRLMLLDQYHLA